MSKSKSFLTCTTIVIIFFFNQKTAYEMRISAWSSDVCSTDLQMTNLAERPRLDRIDQHPHPLVQPLRAVDRLGRALAAFGSSEERRVGKESVSTGRSRWSP